MAHRIGWIIQARQETTTTCKHAPPSMVGRTSEAGKMNKASRGPTIPGTLAHGEECATTPHPPPRLFRIGRFLGDLGETGDLREGEMQCILDPIEYTGA